MTNDSFMIIIVVMITFAAGMVTGSLIRYEEIKRQVVGYEMIILNDKKFECKEAEEYGR